MKTDKKWKRICLNCKKFLFYSNVYKLKRAINNNSVCNSCAKLGKNHPMYGKKRPDVSKRMIGKNNPHYGKSNYDIWLKKYGKEEADKRLANITGENHPNKRPEIRKK